jgi:hypothetical protein
MSKTNKVLAGITTTALMLSISGCGPDPQKRPPVPKDESCRDWEWDDEDGVWQCDDSSSRYYGHSYYGGHYYSSKSLLHKSKDYHSYKKSSGFGGGSKYFGG